METCKTIPELRILFATLGISLEQNGKTVFLLMPVSPAVLLTSRYLGSFIAHAGPDHGIDCGRLNVKDQKPVSGKPLLIEFVNEQKAYDFIGLFASQT